MTPKEKKAAAARQRAYTARLKASGLKQRSIYVPDNDEANADYDRAVARLRKKWGL